LKNKICYYDHFCKYFSKQHK